MNTTGYRFLVSVLALIGLADSIYLTDIAFTGSTLVCDIAGLDGCNVVAQSVYSKVLGVPLAAYGVLFYGVFILTFLYSTIRQTQRMQKIVFQIAVAGALFSSYFIYLQVFVIKALCIYCIGSAIVAYLLTILTYFYTRKSASTSALSS